MEKEEILELLEKRKKELQAFGEEIWLLHGKYAFFEKDLEMLLHMTNGALEVLKGLLEEVSE